MSINVKKKWKHLFAMLMAAVLMVGSFSTEYVVFAAEGAESSPVNAKLQEISGFVPLKESQSSIYTNGKIPLDLLLARMPAAVEVYLDDAADTVSIPINWKCEGDYQGTNYYYYQFDPEWDENQYALSSRAAKSIPYIGVFITESSYFRMRAPSENKEIIYRFVKEKLGMNTAAACGVLANIQSESSFNPTANVIDTNGLMSYGICQWNGPRFEALKAYCSQNGYDYRTLDGQLNYLKYELEHSEYRAFAMIRNVDNTAEGAYMAGYNWARYFERCASVYFEWRGKLARDTYWPMYGTGDSSIPTKKYTISYQLNGGTNDSSNPKSYYNTSENIILKAPTKKGYTFEGWYSDSGLKNQISVIDKGSSGNLKLYAKWRPNRYTIQFDGNQSTGGSMSDMNLDYNERYSLKKNTFRRDGYTYQGWNSKRDGSGVFYEDREEVENLSSQDGKQITLYAQWGKRSYTISYQVNGGKVTAGSKKKYDVNTKTFALKAPTRTGYTFEGWYKEKNYKTKVTEIKKGSTGNITLYAKWNLNRYKIKYNGNGATSGSMKDANTYKYGKTYKLASNAFLRKGYTFTGWNTKANGSGKSYANKADVRNLSVKNGQTITLYAQWKKKAYTIKYNLNGGTMTGNPGKYYVNTKTFRFKSPEREGYTFMGWYTDSSYKKKIAEVKKGTAKKLTLYARWRVNKYTIQFDGNGATAGKTESMQDCKFGRGYTLSSNGFRKKGYTFIGWSVMPDGGDTFYGNQAKVENLSEKNGETITLYAQWEKR